MGYSWTCKFCNQKKRIDRIQLFSPSDNDICYLEMQEAEPDVMGDYKIVFVIDISGSMSQPCKNTVSRLEAVKKAVTAKIRQMTKTAPKRKIGLILFNNVVKMYGSNLNSTVGNNLDSMDYLLREGRSNSDIKTVDLNGNNLIQIINGLTPDGGTALGPALLVALGMLTNTRGSRIIVCTDGESNVGIGALYQTDPNPNLLGSVISLAMGMLQNRTSVNQGEVRMDPRVLADFYHRVTDLAKSQAVTISINSFDDCELSVLELLARETGGNVRRISPTDLHIHMDEDISRDIVATNTIVKVVVPTEMFIHPSGQVDRNQSTASCTVGNVADNNNHTICFEFGCRPGFRVNQGWQKSAAGNYYLPFQVQLKFQDKNGRKLTRVVSMLRELTQHHKFAKLCMNAETVVTSLVQTAAKHLLENKGDSKVAQDFLKIAQEHKNIDKIKFNPQLTFKLDMFILVLEKISAVKLNDEMSALLSQMAKMA